MAEAMLFLRSQLLCGRWATMLNNYVCNTRNIFKQFWPQMTDTAGIELAC